MNNDITWHNFIFCLFCIVNVIVLQLIKILKFFLINIFRFNILYYLYLFLIVWEKYKGKLVVIILQVYNNIITSIILITRDLVIILQGNTPDPIEESRKWTKMMLKTKKKVKLKDHRWKSKSTALPPTLNLQVLQVYKSTSHLQVLRVAVLMKVTVSRETWSPFRDYFSYNLRVFSSKT